MTSMADESVSTILVSCKQTRFHIANPDYRELDIEGLNITVTSGDKAPAGKVKGKGKAKSEGTEILANAKLRLKGGQRYALVGRNGSGKTTLLRAIAEKLIPGIPEETRVSFLQQTRISDANTDSTPSDAAPGDSNSAEAATVLEDVINRATMKDELERDIKTLTQGVNSADPIGTVRALRTLRHEQLQRQLFRLDKDARLRSGARGLKARQALIEGEQAVAASAALIAQKEEEISPETIQADIQDATDLLAELQIKVEPSKVAETESRAKRILSGLGFTETYLSKPTSSLSGGWAMRAALAVSLLQDTDILILDEPTNYLDLLGIIWLQRYLQSLEDIPDAPTLILVSHDRDFISLCTDLLILKDKDLTYFHGDLPMYEDSRAERKVYLTKMKEAKDKQKAHIQDTITRSIKQGKKSEDDNKLRQAKSRQKKLDERWGMEVGQKGGRFKLNRDLAGYHFTARADIEIPQDERGVTVLLPEPPELRFPGALISIENASFRYPAKGAKSKTLPPLTLQDISLSVHMGDRVGIIGLNGAGKSTLIRLLVEEAKPTAGTITTHARLRLGYYSQHAVDGLQEEARADPALTALALMTREVAGELDEGEVRGMLGALGLPGRVASDTPVARLSGGQLVRLQLARLLWRRPHCLVLDEVTTHLDYETVTALREALREWPGAVVLVSHDRWFVRGAVEGLAEDGGADSDEDEDDEEDEGPPRRRAVYRLKAGKMELLPGGVQDFEDLMEKRVKKLLAS